MCHTQSSGCRAERPLTSSLSGGRGAQLCFGSDALCHWGAHQVQGHGAVPGTALRAPHSSSPDSAPVSAPSRPTQGRGLGPAMAALVCTPSSASAPGVSCQFSVLLKRGNPSGPNAQFWPDPPNGVQAPGHPQVLVSLRDGGVGGCWPEALGGSLLGSARVGSLSTAPGKLLCEQVSVPRLDTTPWTCCEQPPESAALTEHLTGSLSPFKSGSAPSLRAH